ncbi:patatin-like protein 5, partial [Macadamia integrifolia]|uniref:patatin-like protein 5 n=1 Tax=Macadamia integrifolia TaxID=60698 RepID=UPI001C4E47CD
MPSKGVVNMERGHCIELSMRMLASLCILLIITEPTVTEGRYQGSKSDRISNSDNGITTILSIDGGGVKGVIPGTILKEFESMLQEIDGDENARIADYFDIVAGTSTGGIITGLLTAPDESGRPLYSAKEINQFYFDHAPDIFWLDESLNPFVEALRELLQPKYNGTNYYKVVREMIGGIRLDETVTNVVIPTYDMKLLKPTIFTSFHAKRDESMMALLSDVVIGTAAAPTLFPPYSFQITTSEGVTTKFNLYDGALVAGNPTLVALTETVKEMNGNVDYTKFRVLSLGTGTEEFQGYEADSHCWGKVALKYLLYDPILSTAGERMAEVYAGMLLRTDIYPNNYIRIQVR